MELKDENKFIISVKNKNILLLNLLASKLNNKVLLYLTEIINVLFSV
jgi:hypothetical protein